MQFFEHYGRNDIFEHYGRNDIFEHYGRNAIFNDAIYESDKKFI